MKKNYILPEIEIIKLNAADIITASLVAVNNEDLMPDLLGE